MIRNCIVSTLAASALTGAAVAQVSCPDDFDQPGQVLAPLAAYFGGVGGFGSASDAGLVYSGLSDRLWINFRHDSFFHIAGAQFGSLDISGPNLVVPPDADTFSITVRPPATGRFQMQLTLREDDNGDGVIDAAAADDQWEAGPILLDTTTSVYNIPLSSFVDGNPGVGNDVRNFATTGHMAIIVALETRATLPGGIVEYPVEFRVDHVGLFRGPQVIPAPPAPCSADFDGDGDTGTDADITAFFACIAGNCCPTCQPADFDRNGDVGTDADIEAFFRVLAGGVC